LCNSAVPHLRDANKVQYRTRSTDGQPSDLRSDRNAPAHQHGAKARNRNMNIAYPLRFDAGGRTAQTDASDHIRDLIEQVLFTAPGERVNRPTFGSGALQLVFTPASDAVAAAVQLTIQGALQQVLGDRIQAVDVQAVVEDATLRVKVSYLNQTTQQRSEAEFTRSAP
jgi:phage baseplate assembly protein W